MAPLLSDGVPGVEALHTIVPSPPFDPDAFTLNDWMDRTTGVTKQWADYNAFTRVTEIQGLRAKPDSDDPRVNLNYQPGERPFPRLMRGKTLTYSGVVAGQTMSAMRNREQQLATACINGQSDPLSSYMSVQYDPTYDESGLTFFGYGLVVAYDCTEQQGSGDALPSAYQRPFTLTFRMRDARWFEQSQIQSCGYDGLPPTLPGTWLGIADGVSGTLNMPGTAPSDPVVSMFGEGSLASDTIKITMAEAGTQLQLVLPDPLADGDILVVDYRTRSVTYTPVAGGGARDYSGYIDWANTSAWDEAAGGGLALGANTITVNGCPWAAYAYPACW